MKRTTKTRLLILTAALALVFVILGVWAFFIEPNRLVIHEERISLARWPAALDGIKLVAISDIHAGSPFVDEQKLRDMVVKTNQTNPDLIVLLGDFMSRDNWSNSRIAPEVIAEILKDLHAQLGVYAVLGNHDWWFDGNRTRHALENSGIKVLENDVARIEKGSDGLWLVGLADAWTRPQNINGTLQRVPQGEPILVLTHNPDVFVEIPATVALTLAGHTHGGQVNLPGLGRRIVPSDYGERYAAGHIQEQGKHLFVTTGIGTSVFPVRFRVPPEIAVLTVSSAR